MTARLYGWLAAAGVVLGGLGACNFHEERGGLPDRSGGGGGGAAYARLAAELFGPSCAKCHNPGRSAAGVDLTSYATVVNGRSAGGGALIVGGEPGASLVVQVIESGRMPPGGTVRPKLVAGLRCWIEKGAPEEGADECFAEAGLTPGPGDGKKETPPAPSPEKPAPKEPVPCTEAGSGHHGHGHHDGRDDGPDDDRGDDDGCGGADGGGGTPPPAPPPPTPTPNPTPTPALAFAEIWRDVLDPYCAGCHFGDSGAEGVDVTTAEALRSGSAVFGDGDGQAQALVVPGDPDASLLWRVVDTDRMPYGSDPLTPAQKALVRRWIFEGATP